MGLSKRTKTALIINLQQVIVGIDEHLTEPSVMINGQSFTPTEIKQMLQDHIDGQKAADTMHAEWISRLATLRATFTETLEPVVLGIERYITGKYGMSPVVLGKFGFKVPKTPYRSTEGKKAAIEKMRATRKARGTLGKRQRLAIHGVVPPPDDESPTTK